MHGGRVVRATVQVSETGVGGVQLAASCTLTPPPPVIFAGSATKGAEGGQKDRQTQSYTSGRGDGGEGE